jgi:hypothetical protein
VPPPCFCGLGSDYPCRRLQHRDPLRCFRTKRCLNQQSPSLVPLTKAKELIPELKSDQDSGRKSRSKRKKEKNLKQFPNPCFPAEMKVLRSKVDHCFRRSAPKTANRPWYAGHRACPSHWHHRVCNEATTPGWRAVEVESFRARATNAPQPWSHGHLRVNVFQINIGKVQGM